MSPAFQNLDADTQSLLQLVYEDVLSNLSKKHDVSTTQPLRNEVAFALLALAQAGQRNSFQLKRYGVARGVQFQKRDAMKQAMIKQRRGSARLAQPDPDDFEGWRKIFGFDDRDIPPFSMVHARYSVLLVERAAAVDTAAIHLLDRAYDAAREELGR